MQFWVIQTVNAVAYGSLLFLIASGFSLIFGLMNITNLTHAAYYMLGSYLGFAVANYIGNFFLAILVAGVVIAVIGVVNYRLFLSNLQGQQLSQVLLSLGLLFVLDDVMLFIFGGYPQQITPPQILSGSIPLMGVTFPIYRLFLIGVGMISALGLYLMVEKTKMGSIIRAGVDDEETTRAMGVNINQAFVGVYALGTFLAAAGGVMGGPILGMEPRMSFVILPLALVVVIIGGLGNLRGAFFGSIIVAMLDNFGRALIPDLSYFTLFLPMALILTFKPSGLFGSVKVVD